MRSIVVIVVSLLCCMFVSCRHNAYYNFTEYAQYTKHIDGQRNWHHTYKSSVLVEELVYHDTAFAVNYIDDATVSIGGTRFYYYNNTDSTITFVTAHRTISDTSLYFNFRNSSIIFKRSAQVSSSTGWFAFDVFTAI